MTSATVTIAALADQTSASAREGGLDGHTLAVLAAGSEVTAEGP